MTLPPLLFAVLAGAANLIGALVVTTRRGWSPRALQTIVAFSAGFLIAVALAGLLPEALAEHGESAALVALAGYVLVHLTQHVLGRHFHFGEETHEVSRFAGFAALGGLMLHTFVDGVAIASGFQVSPELGLLVFLGIFLHKVPEGLAISSLFLASGASRRQALTAAVVLAAATVLGALVAGRLADKVGRRPVMVLSAIVFAVTAAWAGLADTATMFTIARFVSGLAVGAASVVCPAYIAEVSPAHLRGRLASLQQLGIVLGIFTALLSDEVLARAAGGPSMPLWGGLAAWRWMFLVGIVPSVVYGFLAWRLPESPRYLAGEGREDEAKDVLKSIFESEEGRQLPCGLVNEGAGERVSWFCDAAATEGVNFPKRSSVI